MNELEIRKIAKEEFISNVMNNLDSTLIFTYIQNLEQKVNNLQSKIDKVNRILNANAHVENIYHALCNLFDKEYQYEIDNEELNKILKEDK